MTITLTPQTQKLLEERMEEGDFNSPEELIRTALEGLIGEPFHKLDSETQAAIGRAEAQADAGEGFPIDEAFGAIRKKHFGQ